MPVWADAAGRLVILSATTAVLAHLLGPSDFGETALILSIVTIFTVFVGAPYEEALAQRRRDATRPPRGGARGLVPDGRRPRGALDP